ncbi:iron-sulfur cluster repair di-iron protein [Weeksellaceae bacterium KMM 9713]|uniref:Iron-sulfur cluster repair di-iron protein n=1 Tax=Profundicola chukchiensis TaxID=2961959 RepID=A0A9X4MXI9_9FLAO|nr:iron-sulfur cluster repair di-iron protein [Profundicola chukchiensis]MDG4945367.1 iron-sulfur cluster repair di-iron protein [Profundicola chukchiensis]
METLNKKTIGEYVAEDFRTAAVFKKNKIDFCCRGNRSLEEVCEKEGIDYELISKELEASVQSNTNNSIDFNTWPLDLLSDYVEKTHHRYVEEKSVILQQFLSKLVKVHGGNHPELFEINQIFNSVAQGLAAHMKKEELILFPFIRKMVKAQMSNEKLPQAHFGSVENPIDMMEHEHTEEGDKLRRLAELANEYQPPADACNTYRVTFAMLDEFEQDLHKHIHLENNILFPKSIELEKVLAKN